MLVIPAIDLLDGKVVRLKRGDPAHSVVYSDKPLGIVKKWKDEGASLIHLVDLSAAMDEGDNRQVIEEILAGTDIKIQVGGGIRDLGIARDLIGKGVHRIILGTRAVDEDFLDTTLREVGPDNVAVSVDARDGFVSLKGWKEKTGIRDTDLLKTLEQKGLKWVIYTDISLDGTMSGIRIDKLRFLRDFSTMNIIISGGVASIRDIRSLKEELPFVYGVITGKALYENKIDYRRAQELAAA